MSKFTDAVAAGSIVLAGGLASINFGSDEECIGVRDELIQKMEGEYLTAEEVASLDAIYKYGCGVLSEDPPELQKIEGIFTVDDRVYYSRDMGGGEIHTKANSEADRKYLIDYINSYQGQKVLSREDLEGKSIAQALAEFVKSQESQ